jgi:hypothetical protein
MKTVLVLAAAAVVATTVGAQAASASRNVQQQQHNVGWASRQHVYAADHYAPWYDSYGNNNMNPDFQLVH